MANKREEEACYVLMEDAAQVERRARRRRHVATKEDVVDPWSSVAKRGLGTLRLTVVEYRILRFLAAWPNRAFSSRRIAEAVSTPRYRVTTDTLDEHIRALRGQLGFYSDTIQAVPYIGYRFAG